MGYTSSLYRFQLFHYIPSSLSSISQMNSDDTQARMERMNHIQTELEELAFQDSTLAQQIEQFQQACHAAEENLGRMRFVQFKGFSM